MMFQNTLFRRILRDAREICKHVYDPQGAVYKLNAKGLIFVPFTSLETRVECFLCLQNNYSKSKTTKVVYSWVKTARSVKSLSTCWTPNFDSRQGQTFLYVLLQSSDRFLVPPILFFTDLSSESYCLVSTAIRTWTDYLRTSNLEVKNAWSFTFTPHTSKHSCHDTLTQNRQYTLIIIIVTY